MKTALLLVDAQRNMLEGDVPVPSSPQVRSALESLVQAARASDALVVHIQNDGPPGDPDEPGTLGWELVFTADPADIAVRKGVPDTFEANPQLATALKDRSINRVVVAGMQSEYCVAATSLGALAAGFQVVLASGAHATYDGQVPAAETSRAIEEKLETEGVKVEPFEEIKFSDGTTGDMINTLVRGHP